MHDPAHMNEFLKKIAEILEVESVSDTDDLRAFPQWDSLAVLSVIAMLDANYGVNLRAADLQEAPSAGALWELVQSTKGR
jgi:acyl carrier protein